MQIKQHYNRREDAPQHDLEAYEVEELTFEECIILMDRGQIIVKAIHEPEQES